MAKAHMSFVRLSHRAGRYARQKDSSKDERVELVACFPLGRTVYWFGESAGTVVGYDNKRGRVKTSKNGTDGYNPNELSLQDPNKKGE